MAKIAACRPTQDLFDRYITRSTAEYFVVAAIANRKYDWVQSTLDNGLYTAECVGLLMWRYVRNRMHNNADFIGGCIQDNPLLVKNIDTELINQMLIDAGNKKIQIVKVLLEDFRSSPGPLSYELLARCNSFGMLRVLLGDPRITPDMVVNEKNALRYMEKGYSSLLKYLLNSGKVDPSANNRLAW